MTTVTGCRQGGVGMQPWAWVLLVIVVIVLAVAIWAGARQRRTTSLRQRFGPEYDRTLEATDDRRGEEQADLVSVDHPQVVEDYRAAYAVYTRQQEGQASTEDLRNALVRYRSLFEELLRPEGGAAGDRTDTRTDTRADTRTDTGGADT